MSRSLTSRPFIFALAVAAAGALGAQGAQAAPRGGAKAQAVKAQAVKAVKSAPAARWTLAEAPRRAGRGPIHEGRSVARAGGRLDYGPGRRTGYAPLVGEAGTGLGFYALPAGVRAGAARYAARGERGPRWSNPVRFAMMSDALRSNYFGVVGSAPYRYGVMNPIDGVGTPFFAGWYGQDGGWTSSPFYAPGLW